MEINPSDQPRFSFVDAAPVASIGMLFVGIVLFLYYLNLNAGGSVDYSYAGKIIDLASLAFLIDVYFSYVASRKYRLLGKVLLVIAIVCALISFFALSLVGPPHFG